MGINRKVERPRQTAKLIRMNCSSPRLIFEISLGGTTPPVHSQIIIHHHPFNFNGNHFNQQNHLSKGCSTRWPPGRLLTVHRYWHQIYKLAVELVTHSRHGFFGRRELDWTLKLMPGESFVRTTPKLYPHAPSRNVSTRSLCRASHTPSTAPTPPWGSSACR